MPDGEGAAATAAAKVGVSLSSRPSVTAFFGGRDFSFILGRVTETLGISGSSSTSIGLDAPASGTSALTSTGAGAGGGAASTSIFTGECSSRGFSLDRTSVCLDVSWVRPESFVSRVVSGNRVPPSLIVRGIESSPDMQALSAISSSTLASCHNPSKTFLSSFPLVMAGSPSLLYCLQFAKRSSMSAFTSTGLG